MMGNRLRVSTVVTALAAFSMGAVLSFGVSGTASQGQDQDQAQRPAQTPDGRPNFNGVWQALNEAHWDLQAHEALPGMVMQEGVYPYEYARVPAAPVVALGAAAGVPGSMGVVQGDGSIPYRPETLQVKQENGANWIDRDPELKCYLPGTPRAMYMPYPFQIVQGTNKIHMNFAFSNAAPHHPPGRGRSSAGLFLHGALGRTVGRRHAGGRGDGLQRQELVRPGRELPQ